LESLAFSPVYIFHPHSMALIGAFAALLPGTIFAALCRYAKTTGGFGRNHYGFKE
jgi:hypothetical protein